MVADEVLGAKPPQGGGFDAMGFRNRTVPESVDIVAIGDSHTYGNTATMANSWPYVLARSSAQRVYNMGMGGYGPNQYFHLLKTKAAHLKPRAIMIGLYLGDDFENAFLITYGLKHWEYLRRGSADATNFDIWAVPPPNSWHKQVRAWLSRHSVVYQLAFHASMLGTLQGETQIRNAQRFSDSIVTVSIPEKNILEAFHPKGMLENLKQDSPAVQEGMRITFELIEQMNGFCRELGAQLVVVIIPTKEMVFAEYMQSSDRPDLQEVVQKLIADQSLAREKLFSFLQQANIPFVDTLPSLRKQSSQSLYARSAADMHPGRNGYRVIGEAVSDALHNGALKGRVPLSSAPK